MNKKFLSAVLFGALMVGSSVTFTGCIDNDEPAGIENLRGAKAELLRAKVAVEAAIAARENAQATFILAQAETEKAKAEIEKAKAEMERLQAESQAAKNEEEKARLEMQIAQHKQQMEQDALDHQAKMLTLQEGLADAKRSYELALKEIEIAQAIVSEQDRVTLGELKMAVNDAQGKVDEKATAVEETTKKYYEAALESKNDTVVTKELELAVARKKAAQTTAEETLAKWQDFTKKDTETADWRKEITTLEDSITGLEKKQSELNVELARLQNSDAYKKLQADKDATAKAYAELKTSAKLEYKDMRNEIKTVNKGTLVADAVKTIGGEKADGKGGFIKDMNDKIAGYTSEKKALLDEVAKQTENEVKAKKDASDKAIKAWKDAMGAWEAVQNYTTEASDKKAVTDALDAYTTAMNAAALIANATEKAKAEVKAQQTFADAIVKYYNAAAPLQLTCNTITLKVTVNGKDTYPSKTVKEWLSDSNNKDVYLASLINYFSNNATLLWSVGKKETVTAGSAPTVKATGALATLKTKDNILADLRNASSVAFGTGLLVSSLGEDGYMRVEPTQAEVKAVKNYDLVCGALGAYYAATDEEYQFEAKNYKAIIADYEKAVTYWTEQLAALNKANADAKAAKEAAEKALKDYQKANFEAINTLLGEISDRITALNNVKGALIDAVNTWLPENGNYQETEKFEAWLKSQVEGAEDAVIKTEKAVVEAEIKLMAHKDGKYDALSDAKAELDKAMAELEAAQAELAEATANLQKGIEIMTKASAE